jgi:preprotein translocase subunit YajC
MSQYANLLLWFALVALAFYFLMLRPQQQQQRRQRELMAALKPGDRVVTVSGIFGTIQSVEADSVMLRVAEGVDIEVARGAVSSIVHSFSEGPTEPPTSS